MKKEDFEAEALKVYNQWQFGVQVQMSKAQTYWLIRVIADGFATIHDQALEEAAEEIPDNWLDSLLMGNERIVRESPCREVEQLLDAIRKRIRALKVKS